MSQEEEAIADIQRLLALTWRPWGSIPLDPNAIIRSWSLDLGWLEPTAAEELLTKLIATGWLTAVADGLQPPSGLGEVPVPLGWFPRKRLLAQPPNYPREEVGGELSGSSGPPATKDSTSAPEQTEEGSESDKVAKTEKVAKVAKADKVAKVAKAEKVAKVAKADKVATVAMAEKVEKADKAESAQQGEVGVASDEVSSEGVSIEQMPETGSIDIPALLQAISDATKIERQEVMRRAQRKRRALGDITVWMALILVARELGLDPASLLPK